MATPTPSEILVCVTCRPAGAPREGQAAGQALFEAIEDEALRVDAPWPVRAVECMSACSHSCTVALQGAGKLSYLFGDLLADGETAAQVLQCAALHARSPDGLMAWADRPERLRRGVMARLPPPLPPMPSSTPSSISLPMPLPASPTR